MRFERGESVDGRQTLVAGHSIRNVRHGTDAAGATSCIVWPLSLADLDPLWSGLLTPHLRSAFNTDSARFVTEVLR